MNELNDSVRPQNPETLIQDCDLLLRNGALDSLCGFAELVDRNYRAARFHELLARKLEDCYARKIRRLAVSCPPRHGKSRMAAAMFPAWAMTKNPRLEFIQAAYSADLSERFSMWTKDILRSPRRMRFFPDPIDPTRDRMNEWFTKEGGAYFATGIGGGAVGRGANFLIVDDPIKGRKEANSKIHRDTVWNWFMSTALTRLSPDGVAIVIATRWHEDDLIGRLTNAERVDQLKDAGFDDMNFEVLNLEALCEHPETDQLGRKFGEALWPERWNERALQAFKVQEGKTTQEWDAQYMGRPSPPEGNLVNLSAINFIDREQVPKNIPLMRAWDLAYSETEQADFSAGAYGGGQKYTVTMPDAEGKPKVINRRRLYLVDMDRGKRKWPVQKERIISHAEREGTKVGMEAQSKWEPAFNEVKQALQGRVTVGSYSPNQDKVSRAMPWLQLAESGDLYIVKGPWNQDFMEELRQFPNGNHDDQVDAVSVLDIMTRAGNLMLI